MCSLVLLLFGLLFQSESVDRRPILLLITDKRGVWTDDLLTKALPEARRKNYLAQVRVVQVDVSDRREEARRLLQLYRNVDQSTPQVFVLSANGQQMLWFDYGRVGSEDLMVVPLLLDRPER